MGRGGESCVGGVGGGGNGNTVDDTSVAVQQHQCGSRHVDKGAAGDAKDGVGGSTCVHQESARAGNHHSVKAERHHRQHSERGALGRAAVDLGGADTGRRKCVVLSDTHARRHARVRGRYVVISDVSGTEGVGAGHTAPGGHLAGRPILDASDLAGVPRPLITGCGPNILQLQTKHTHGWQAGQGEREREDGERGSGGLPRRRP